jgi:hypothetical protein
MISKVEAVNHHYKEAGMLDPFELTNAEIYCNHILEQISREEHLHKIQSTRPSFLPQVFTFAGDFMIRTGIYLKAQALHERPAQSPTIFL